jgi:hypothetical protein
MIGKVFNSWTVLERAENDKKNNARFLCRCICGKEKVVYKQSLVNGNSKSCGCKNYKNLRKTPIRHGMTGTPIYTAWTHMRLRCLNPKDRNYKNYGGRGIKICSEWDSFENFCEWSINNGYKEGLSIDRINNDGNYEPDNCRWATSETQQNNRRVTRYITINGVTKSLSEWAKETGIPRSTIYSRLVKNYPPEEIIRKVE